MGVTRKMPIDFPSEGNESTRSARQAIDQAIDDLEAQIRSLREARNQLAPTSILPPEILSKIFILVRDSPTDLYASRRRHSTHWICSVGHICRHWREVAHNCPALWSIPIFTNPELVQEMMRHSRMAALTIRVAVGSWTPDMLSQVENAMTQIFRIQDLHLSCGSHSDKLHNIFTSFSQPAPHLEKLALINSEHFTHNSHIPLPDNVFADAPRLRSIKLEGFNLCWKAPVFKYDLTTLKIRTSRAPDTSTFSQLLEVLGHMSNLQNLSLVECIPSHATAGEHDPILDFPALCSLKIASKTANCIRLLRWIKYPPHTVVNLACTSCVRADDYTAIFARVGEILRTPGGGHSSQTFQWAKLELDRDHSMTVSLYPDTGPSPFLIGYRGNLGVRLHFHYIESREYPFDNVLRGLFQLIDLDSLESVVFDWSSGDKCLESIRETIGRLPNLENFHTGAYGAKVLRAIQSSPGPVSTRGQGRTGRRKPPVTVFPALNTLTLYDLDLNESRSPKTLDIIEAILVHRSEIKAPIEELQLDRCRGVRAEQKRLLVGLVDNLMVDGEYIEGWGRDFEDGAETSSEEEEDD